MFQCHPHKLAPAHITESEVEDADLDSDYVVEE
jgi:hypothetical protein